MMIMSQKLNLNNNNNNNLKLLYRTTTTTTTTTTITITMIQIIVGIILLSTFTTMMDNSIVVVVEASRQQQQQQQPNPPKFPDSVKVFGPDTNPLEIDFEVYGAFGVNGGHIPANKGQFTDKRYAFLFKPGNYSNNIPVGYYTHIAGLGASPDDVVFTGEAGVFCEASNQEGQGDSLVTFWRIAENFRTMAFKDWFGTKGMIWAVSQAAPLRRIHVDENLLLYQYIGGDLAAYSSGGFLSDSIVKGQIVSGSQQQFMTRNSQVGMWNGGVWNMVFLGVEGAPVNHCSNQKDAGDDGSGSSSLPHVTIEKTPIYSEKPFIYIPKNKEEEEKKDGGGGSDETWAIHVPEIRRNAKGVQDHNNLVDGYDIFFENIYVTNPDQDNKVSDIQKFLDDGLSIVISPGIYKFDQPLIIKKENTIILGLGLATLISTNGNAVIEVMDGIDGVRIAGLMMEAGVNQQTDSLLRWGSTSITSNSNYKGNPDNPGFLYDIFARVGGSFHKHEQVQADTMVTINAGHVIGDNLWLWRADHAIDGLIYDFQNPNKHGLLVNGDDVKMYGLACEHQTEDLVVWNGERGETYFYQSELPYDASQSNYGDKGYAGYKVAANVKEHDAWGVGVYSYMRDNYVNVKSGIVCPRELEKRFHSSLSVFLNGKGTIGHIINDQGESTGPADSSGGQPAWLCHNDTSSAGFQSSTRYTTTTKMN